MILPEVNIDKVVQFEERSMIADWRRTLRAVPGEVRRSTRT